MSMMNVAALRRSLSLRLSRPIDRLTPRTMSLNAVFMFGISGFEQRGHS